MSGLSRFAGLLEKMPAQPWKFFWTGLAVSFFSSAFFGVIQVLLGWTVSSPTTLWNGSLDGDRLFSLMVFSPIFETLVLVFLASILVPFVWRAANSSQVILVVAALAGAAHGVDFPHRVIPATFSFIVFTYAYIRYRKKSFIAGFGMSVGIHAAHNSLASAMLICCEILGW